MVCCFGCFKGLSESVQVLFHGIETVMILTLIILNPDVANLLYLGLTILK